MQGLLYGPWDLNAPESDGRERSGNNCVLRADALYCKVLSMDTPLYVPTIGPAATGQTAAAPTQISRPIARTILGAAILLGVDGDVLLRDQPAGLGVGLWIAAVVLSAVALLWRSERSVSRETAAWLGTATVFAFFFALRNSGTLLFFDFWTTIACLGMAAVAASDAQAGLLARRLRDTVAAGLTVIGSVIVGIVPLALREFFATGEPKKSSARVIPFARAAIISVALLVVFGALLVSADPIFASLVALPDLDFDTIASHVFLIGFFAWIVGGWSRALVSTRALRSAAPRKLPFELGMLDVSAALGTLNALFAAFVLAQLGWFFGGEKFLQARTGLTAATYARQGFFQLVWVVTLVVPVLMATRATLQPGRELARRHTLLSLPIIGLLGAIIVSATLRMKMYVHFYGLTTDRLYPLVFMGWLAIVLVWLAFTVLRDWARPFVAGAVVSGIAILATLNFFDPDLFVARVNVQRASHVSATTQPSLDVAHLARLRGRAVDLAMKAVLTAPVGSTGSPLRAADDEQRCAAARQLLRQWGPTSAAKVRHSNDGSWRFWNADDVAALRAVGPHTSDLIRVQHATCKTPEHDSH